MAQGHTSPNAVEVEPQYGEAMKRLLLSLDMLDRDRRIAREKGRLVFPLKLGERLEIPKLEIPGCQLTTHIFEDRKARPKSIRRLLRGVLSKDEIPLLGSSYDIVGDVMILELPPELLSRRWDIGMALLSWLPVETVAIKTSPTAGERRVRGLEVIAGRSSLETTHRENGLQFNLDLSKVFFNPRLCGERARVACEGRDDGLILDMFAGVGSFSIAIDRASKTPGMRIYAVDRNEDAIRYLAENARLNRAWGVIAICGDSRVEAPRIAAKVGMVDRVIMNLPGSSDTFLPKAVQCLKIGGCLHYYRLAPKLHARGQIEEELGSVGAFNLTLFREVESYSPSKSIFVADAVLMGRR